MAMCPRKYLIKDLINQTPPLDAWIQGTIEQTVGTDILIIADDSGRAKITKCESADGIIDKSSLKKGILLVLHKLCLSSLMLYTYLKQLNKIRYIAYAWSLVVSCFDYKPDFMLLKSLIPLIITPGTYCCIIGVAIRTKGLPEIQASKFVDLTSNPQMKNAWEIEVKESKLVFEGKIIPKAK